MPPIQEAMEQTALPTCTTLLLDIEHCVAQRPTSTLRGSREKYENRAIEIQSALTAALPQGTMLRVLVNEGARAE